jgi:hypothetical protein
MMVIVSNIVILSAVALYGAVQLQRLEQTRERTERSLRGSEGRLRHAEHLAKFTRWAVDFDPSELGWEGGRAEHLEAAMDVFTVPAAELAVSRRAYLERFVHSVGTIQDITARQEIEKSLRRSEERFRRRRTCITSASPVGSRIWH